MEKELSAVLLPETSGNTSGAARGSTGKRRPQALSRYDRAMRQAGLGVALALTGGLWLTGAYLTLVWLGDHGLSIAAAGTAPIDAFFNVRAERPQPAHHWLWTLGAFSIPLALSAAEIGLWPQRERHPLVVAIWLLFLLFDAITTAAGVVSLLPIDVVTAWLLGLVIGVALALGPEKAGRILVRLLRER
jgi:hypothetical protein